MTKNQEKKFEKLFLAHNCLKQKISSLLKDTKKNLTKIEKKEIEKLLLGQNFLKRIMSQLLDNTKKITKIEKNYLWLKIVCTE